MDYDVMTTEIGDKIRYYRKKKGLTQKELAERINVTQGLITQIETNRKKPAKDKIKKIAEILEVEEEKIDPSTKWFKLLEEWEKETEELYWNGYRTELVMTPEESRFLHNFRKLNMSGKYKMLSEIELTLQDSKYVLNSQEDEDNKSE